MPCYKQFPIPPLTSAMQAYLEQGADPGPWLKAILENNLREVALTSPSDMDFTEAKAIAVWLYCEAPAFSHGSKYLVAAWQYRHGSAGQQMQLL